MTEPQISSLYSQWRTFWHGDALLVDNKFLQAVVQRRLSA